MSWGFWYLLGALATGLHFTGSRRLDDGGGDPDDSANRAAYVAAMLVVMAVWPLTYASVLVAVLARRP